MNHVQREAVFSVPVDAGCDPTVDLPGCTSSTDCTSGCFDHRISPGESEDYLNRTEVPAYAHSHLLTSILGADYVDVNGNGPDKFDKGYWMRIEYARTSSEGNPYKWRTPFMQANRMPGLENLESDDKGSYVYGERDQYYPAKIVTKNPYS